MAIQKGPIGSTIETAEIAAGAVTSAKLDTNIDIAGNLTVDTDTLYVDSANNRVGIGTSSPASLLHVSTAGSGITTVLRLSTTALNTVPGIIFEGDVGGTQHDPARIRAQQDNATSGGLAFDTETSGALTEKMRITAAGNVGIGTNSPSSYNSAMNNLVAYGSGDSGITIASGTASEGSLAFADGTTGNEAYRGWINYNHGSDFMRMFTAGSERMRIDSSGNLLVGKTVAGAINGAGVQLYPNGEGTAVISSATSGNGPLFYFVNLGSTVPNGYRFVTFRATSSFAEVGTITTNGTSTTSYNTTSDYRLKENVVEVTDGIDRVKLLKPSRFNFIVDPDKTVDGFLAHEVQDVVPEAITGTKDAVDADGNPEYQGIDQSKLVPLLTAALQEAITEIESLKSRLDAAGL